MKKEQFSGVTCGPGDQAEICSCPQKEYVIAEEQEALAMLRQIKEKVKVEKARIEEAKQHLEAASEKTEARQPPGSRLSQEKVRSELKACEHRLMQLKVQWDKWDKKRKEATREKLIRLGHGS